MRKIEIEIGGQFVENPEEYLPGTIGTATLFDDLAPKTVEALWKMLPITTRTIHTYRLGQTWRTETNYKLTASGEPDENLAPESAPLPAGNLYYFKPGAKYKVMMVYGVAHSDPAARMSFIGRIDDDGLTALINHCRRILYVGPLNVTFRAKS